MLMLAITVHLRAQLSRLHQQRGASLVEYALLVALIALVAFAAVGSLGETVSSEFKPAGSSLAP